MNADEKAVAELFPCTCGHMFMAADYGHVVGCTAIGEVRALALAARIRADAKREMERLRKAMISTSISVRAAFGINADPELKPWNRQHLCDFLDAIADTIDAALKGDA